MKNYKKGQELLTTCRINGVEAGARVKLVEYREEGWDKAKAKTGKSSVVRLVGGPTRPEHWIAKFISGEVKKSRNNPKGELPKKTFLVYAHMVSAVN